MHSSLDDEHLSASSADTGALPVDLSLIVPCFNEEGNVEAFYREAVQTFEEAHVSIELVFVDDGSRDATLARLREVAADADGRVPVQVISFSRNFGKESAIYAGMKAARGRTLCLIDADLQQPPALALSMFDYLRAHPDTDVVAAYQDVRNEGKVVAWLKRSFYKWFNRVTDRIEIPENMSDFRVFRRSVGEALLSLPESYRFSKGLFAWVGFRTHAVPYTPRERNAGTSKWTVRSLFRYAFSGMMAFSTWPLKVAKWIGAVVSIAAFFYLLYVIIVDYLIVGTGVPGYATLVSLVLLFGGIEMVVLGIMGDYMARDYIEEKRRPLYIVRERIESDMPDGSGERQ
ncbi:MAG: glycosyltransferase family 2 protein [Eggerthellaceae bacterium]|nr:glycosyltransferase family 2 protein [Eggerthellaceae bacterium]